MKKSKRDETSNAEGEEVAGLIELGIGKEALSKSAAILAQPSPTPDAVHECIRAIAVFAPSPARWKARVETLIARLSKQTRHQMRECFVLYFGTINHHERTTDFIVAPGSFSPQAIYIAVTSLLELGRKEDARNVLANAPAAQDDDSLDYLGEAAASVHSAFGNHAEAWQIRRSLPCTSPISRNIVEGMVQSSLALAISDLDVRLSHLETLASDDAFDQTALVIAGNQSELNGQTKGVYRKWRRRLLRLFSEADLRQHRLENCS